jgi:hypothetical protein
MHHGPSLSDDNIVAAQAFCARLVVNNCQHNIEQQLQHGPLFENTTDRQTVSVESWGVTGGGHES